MPLYYSERDTQTNVINAKQYGAMGNGTTDDTAAIQAAINAASGTNQACYIPAGTYLISSQLNLDGTPSLIGDGIAKTIISVSGAITALRVNETATTSDNRYIELQGFTIDCNSVGTYGLNIGNDAGTALRRVIARNIRIMEATTAGLRLRSGIGHLYDRVIVEDCTGTSPGLFIDNENGITTCTFIQCSFRQNHTGLKINSGTRLLFLSCIVESNRQLGLSLDRRNSNGFANSKFIGCWFENNGWSPVALDGPTTATVNPSLDRINSAAGIATNERVLFLTDGTAPSGLVDGLTYWCTSTHGGGDFKVSHTPGGTAIDIGDSGTGTHTVTQISSATASVYSDMLSSVAETHPSNIEFEQCVIASASGAFDVMIDRGTNLVFNTCSFTATTMRGFTATKFGWSSQLTCFAKLINCNSFNERATPAMYANFPAMTSSASISGYDTLGQLGYQYEFDYQNRTYSNGGIWNRTASPYNSIYPARRGELLINTTTNDIYLSNGSGLTSWVQLASNWRTDNAADLDATPSVSGVGILRINNSSGTTITDFDTEVNSQVLKCIILTGNTTIQNNANIKLDNTLNFSPPSGGTLSLINYSGVWYETARATF